MRLGTALSSHLLLPKSDGGAVSASNRGTATFLKAARKFGVVKFQAEVVGHVPQR